MEFTIEQIILENKGNATTIAIFLITILINVWYRYKDKKTKHLNYITSNDRIEVKIKKQKKEQSCKNELLYYIVHSVNVQIANTGTEIIEKEDFKNDLKISLNNESEIIDFFVSNSESEYNELEVKENKTKNGLLVSPLFLNSKDSFSINLLVKDFKKVTRVSCRLKGISEIKQIKYGSIFNFTYTILMVFILVINFNLLPFSDNFLGTLQLNFSFIQVLCMTIFILIINFKIFLKPQFNSKIYNYFKVEDYKYTNLSVETKAIKITIPNHDITIVWVFLIILISLQILHIFWFLIAVQFV